MKRAFPMYRMTAFLPLVGVLALSAVVSQVSQQVTATVVAEQPIIAARESRAEIPLNAAFSASQAAARIPISLSVETFDITRARAVIAASALSGTEKAIFARALEAAMERPEMLAQVLTDLNSALERKG